MNTTSQKFAEDLLRTYGARTAQDWPLGLLFMSTAGSHLQAFRGLRSRMMSAIQADAPGRPAYNGIHVEGLLGEFGSGKSHIAYLLLHDSLHGIPSCLVLHAQMTGDRSLSKVLARLLESGRVGIVDRGPDVDRTVSVFQSMRSRLNLSNPANIQIAQQIVRTVAGSLPSAFCADFIGALSALSPEDSRSFGMSAFLDQWIGSQPERLAVERFGVVVRAIHAAGVVSRMVILLDELEALQQAPVEERSRFLQGMQDLHDNFGGRDSGLPPTFMAVFSTPDFWAVARAILPSMFNEGDRVRKSTRLTGIRRAEIYGLVDRYQMLSVLAGRRPEPLDPETTLRIADEVWAKIEPNPWHMRSVHQAIRDLVLQQP